MIHLWITRSDIQREATKPPNRQGSFPKSMSAIAPITTVVKTPLSRLTRQLCQRWLKSSHLWYRSYIAHFFHSWFQNHFCATYSKSTEWNQFQFWNQLPTNQSILIVFSNMKCKLFWNNNYFHLYSHNTFYKEGLFDSHLHMTASKYWQFRIIVFYSC